MQATIGKAYRTLVMQVSITASRCKRVGCADGRCRGGSQNEASEIGNADFSERSEAQPPLQNVLHLRQLTVGADTAPSR